MCDGCAEVAELADAADSKSAVCKYVPVRVRPSAPLENQGFREIGGLFVLPLKVPFVCTLSALGITRHITKQRHPNFYPFFEGKVGTGGIFQFLGNFRHKKSAQPNPIFFRYGHTDFFSFTSVPCGFPVSGHPACRRTYPW